LVLVGRRKGRLVLFIGEGGKECKEEREHQAVLRNLLWTPYITIR
jgi:hypothetical protein